MFEPANCVAEANPAAPATPRAGTPPSRAAPPATAGASIYGAEPPASSPNLVRGASSQPSSVGLNIRLDSRSRSALYLAASSMSIKPARPANAATSPFNS